MSHMNSSNSKKLNSPCSIRTQINHSILNSYDYMYAGTVGGGLKE